MRALRTVAGMTLVLAGIALITAGAGAAPAASIDDQGWWWRLQADPEVVALPAPPDVSADQLLVEAVPDGASAIAAVRFTVAEGQANPVLTMTAASETGGDGAVVLACQTGSGWTGADAGGWEVKPSPDCASSVQGLRSADGTQWTFALAALQFGGDQVNVVITPGKNPDGTVTPFRIVFDKVTPASVETTGGTADGSGAGDFAPPSLGDFDGAAGSGFTAPATGGSSFALPPSPASEGSLAAQPSQAALPPAEQGQTATAPSRVAPSAPRPVVSSSESGSTRALALVIILAGGALMWWSSQQPVPEPKSLSRFAARSATARDTAAETGGIGRFTSPRAGPVPRL